MKLKNGDIVLEGNICSVYLEDTVRGGNGSVRKLLGTVGLHVNLKKSAIDTGKGNFTVVGNIGDILKLIGDKVKGD